MTKASLTGMIINHAKILPRVGTGYPDKSGQVITAEKKYKQMKSSMTQATHGVLKIGIYRKEMTHYIVETLELNEKSSLLYVSDIQYIN